jgi:hypothetical protein
MRSFVNFPANRAPLFCFESFLLDSRSSDYSIVCKQTGFIWLRIRGSGGLLWTRKWSFEFRKILENSWVEERKAASQGGLDSVQYITNKMSADVTKLWIYTSTHPFAFMVFFLGTTAPVGLGLPPWTSPFTSGFLDLTHSVGLLGRVISSYTNTEKCTHTK